MKSLVQFERPPTVSVASNSTFSSANVLAPEGPFKLKGGTYLTWNLAFFVPLNSLISQDNFQI